MLTHGGLFEGYGGTSMAAAYALGPLRTRWVSEIKPAACVLQRYRHPDVPNLGDMTAAFPADRSLPLEVEPVDVLTASWPCQPHSSAGKRLGEADPRALWPNVARAIEALRPRIFLGENVARITSNGELRRVVRTLAHLGYVGAWRVQRASDAPVYGCHQRARCFVAAVDPAAYVQGIGWGQGWPGTDRHAGRPEPAGSSGDAGVTLLPTPHQNCTTGAGTSGRKGELNLQTAVTLLPTPTAQNYGTNQGGAAGRTGAVRESLDTMARNGRFGDVVLLPTPTLRDATRGAGWGAQPGRPLSETIQRVAVEWGPYAAAVHRWEAVFGRPAPAPTQISPRNGKPQLSAHFVEWMMGLPEGWVTDVPDLAPRANGHRNACLSLLGDGVMPWQGAVAFIDLLGHLADRLAAERVA